jgi:hypothetical protein
MEGRGNLMAGTRHIWGNCKRCFFPMCPAAVIGHQLWQAHTRTTSFCDRLYIGQMPLDTISSCNQTWLGKCRISELQLPPSRAFWLSLTCSITHLFFHLVKHGKTDVMPLIESAHSAFLDETLRLKSGDQGGLMQIECWDSFRQSALSGTF